MNFLNLSLGELLGLAGVLSAGIVALYLLDRSKRRQVVATLRFWAASQVPTEWKRSRRVQQPWSMLLQIISILLLLLAVAGPRLGGNLNSVRNHVMILDTSAWMGARARQGILLDQAKTEALAYIHSLPADDRVMLVRADALATPVTPFSANHEAILNAIRDSQPSASALNLQQALEFADHAQKLQPERPGEITFVGAGRVSKEEAESIALPADVPPASIRVLQIPSAGENAGLRKFSVRRVPDPGKADVWDAFVAVRNDGMKPREVVLELLLGKLIVGSKTMTLQAGSESEVTIRFAKPANSADTEDSGKSLEARIRSTNGRGDAFPEDDRATVALPVEKTLHVTVYTDQPDLLRALLTSNPRVNAQFKTPAQYDAQATPDILILDRFAPPQSPKNPNIVWIDPPPGAPFGVRATVANVKLERWHSEQPLAAGLYTRDVELPSAKVFTLAPGDQAIAEVAEGPVIIARTASPKMNGAESRPESRMVALGFHPVRSSMRYELATPLLMANILHWMSPEAFWRSDVQAGTVGTVNVSLEKGTNPATVRVIDENKRPLPFTVEGNTLRFFSGAPGAVHVLTGDREASYSLTVPDVADAVWKPPATVTHGLSRVSGGGSTPTSLWPWLALLGGVGLLIEWLLYGRSSVVRVRAATAEPESRVKFPWKKAS